MSLVYPCTLDGRYFVVRGRLWRRSNPNLAPQVRQSLTSELMTARRAVRAAKGDAQQMAIARAQVHLAKCALGERGAVWWPDDPRDFNRCLVSNTPYAAWYRALNLDHPVAHLVDDAAIEGTIVFLLRSRSALASSCPSEVARALAPGNEKIWRSLMPRVRNVLASLVSQCRVKVTRGVRVLDVDEFHGGPIRIRRGEKFD